MSSATTGLPQRLRELAGEFAEEIREAQLGDVERVAFQVALVHDRMGGDVRVCDIGSGVGLFPLGCASLGMKVAIIDDFADPVNDEHGDRLLAPHRAHGVEILARDPVADGLGFRPGTLEVVTSFDSMEHWHHSPKALFAEVAAALTPGGMFLLGVPNCVNLRKRITALFGRAKWSGMAEWYEQERFRGHVREPDVDDLHYIARDMGLERVEILGANWAGMISPSAATRAATRVLDRPLRWPAVALRRPLPDRAKAGLTPGPRVSLSSEG